MSEVECPDCEGPETVFSFPPRGNGKCSGCIGTGESYMGLPAVLVGGVSAIDVMEAAFALHVKVRE